MKNNTKFSVWKNGRIRLQHNSNSAVSFIRKSVKFYRVIIYALLAVLFLIGCRPLDSDDEENNSGGSSSAAELKSFTVDGVAAVADANDATVFTVLLLPGTDLSSLEVTDVEVSAGASLTAPAPLTGVDFRNPVTFTVTAANGATKNYAVVVKDEASPSATELFGFKVDGFAAVVDPDDPSVFTVTVPQGRDLSSLAVTDFSLPDGASVTAPASLTDVNFTNSVTFTVTASDGTTKDYTITVKEETSRSAAELKSFTVDGVAAVADLNDATVFTVLLLKGTDLSSLDVTDVEVSDGASVTTPASLTGVNFSGPVIFTVKAADGTTKDYTVRVEATAASDAAELTGLKVDGVAAVVDAAAGTFVVAIPKNRSLSSLDVTDVEVSAGASVTTPTSLTSVNFSGPVIFTVTAADGTTKDYTVRVEATAASDAAELTGLKVDGVAAIVDTAASTFVVTIPKNRSLSSLDVTDVEVSAGASLTAPAPLTGVNFSNPVTFTVTAENGTTKDYMVRVQATATSDAAELTGLKVDGVAAVVDAAASTFVVTIPKNRNLSSLEVTDVTTSAGASLTAPTSLTGVNFSSSVTFTVRAENGTTKDYTVRVEATAASDAAELTGLKVYGVTAIVDTAASTFVVTIPKNRSLSSLDVTDVELSDGASLTAPAPLTGVNFGSPVTFTVTAENGTTKDYTVRVVATAASDAAELTGLKVDGVAAVVDAAASTFVVTIPKNRNLSSLDVTDVTTSAGANLTAPTSLTGVNFSSSVTFTVRAENGTTKDYTVRVEATAASDAAELTGLKVYGVAAVVDTAASTFVVTIPKNRNLSSLDVTDVTTSAGASLTAPTSLTGVNFSSSVIFTVTAEDGTTTKDYTVRVEATAASDATELTGLKVDGVAAVVDAAASRLGVLLLAKSVLDAYDVTDVELSDGASLTAPTSLTGVKFSSPVTFTVTAENGTTKDYTVAVGGILAGSNTAGRRNGTGPTAQFDSPYGITFDSGGNLYVTDSGNHRIRKITPAGAVTTFAGSRDGFRDRQGTGARFSTPYGITVDTSGNFYVADSGNNRIRKITSTGAVTTLAGQRNSGFLDGQGTVAKFDSPHGVTFGTDGNLYVTDYENHRIRKVTPAGAVTTLAGNGFKDFRNGQGTDAEFYDPEGITFTSNHLYVTGANDRIRKITLRGFVFSIPIPMAHPSQPKGITAAPDGNLYIAGFRDKKIYKFTLSGAVTSVLQGIEGPKGIAFSSDGTAYITDGNRILRIPAAVLK